MRTFAWSVVALALCSSACVEDKDPLASASDPSTTGPSTSNPSTTNPSTSNPSTTNPSTTNPATTDDPTAPTEGGTATEGDETGGTGAQHPSCAAWLDCVSVTAPQTLPDLNEFYGPDGDCWQGDPATQQQCIDACELGLMNSAVAFPDEPKCCQDPGCGGTSSSETTEDPDLTTGFDPNCQDAPNQPQDAECSDASGCGCASGNCFLVPILGGWCGACLEDADCPGGGCTTPNPIAGKGAQCNQGGPGDGCQTDAACNAPAASHCGEIYAIPGIITVSTCGACASDGDCGGQAPNCAPDYELGAFTGELKCRPDGSVPNGEGCAGDDECASGKCGEANVMGLLKLGVCGECLSNADCGGGSCSDPVADVQSGTLTPAQCN